MIRIFEIFLRFWLFFDFWDFLDFFRDLNLSNFRNFYNLIFFCRFRRFLRFFLETFKIYFEILSNEVTNIFLTCLALGRSNLKIVVSIGPYESNSRLKCTKSLASPEPKVILKSNGKTLQIRKFENAVDTGISSSLFPKGLLCPVMNQKLRAKVTANTSTA